MSLTIALTEDITACHGLRRTVFIEEQNVPEDLELDDLDHNALHLLAVLDDQPIGTARIIIQKNVGKIGRVCVVADHRGTGLGRKLMQACLKALREHDGITTAKLSSQTQVIPFYQSLGFAAYGPEYMDAGIPHRDMECQL